VALLVIWVGIELHITGSMWADVGFTASLCSTASYVDIKAKTDTYVGFLPSHALERLLEKRPIVLLTLAKRLISLLSPLGKSRDQYSCAIALLIFIFM
jgi:hypothetical protein